MALLMSFPTKTFSTLALVCTMDTLATTLSLSSEPLEHTFSDLWSRNQVNLISYAYAVIRGYSLKMKVLEVILIGNLKLRRQCQK